MEARGESKGRPKSKHFVDISRPFAREPTRRVRGGFWMDLGRILGGFWRDLEALGGPNGHENRYISKKIQALPPGSPKEGFG